MPIVTIACRLRFIVIYIISKIFNMIYLWRIWSTNVYVIEKKLYHLPGPSPLLNYVESLTLKIAWGEMKQYGNSTRNTLVQLLFPILFFWFTNQMFVPALVVRGRFLLWTYFKEALRLRSYINKEILLWYSCLSKSFCICNMLRCQGQNFNVKEN